MGEIALGIVAVVAVVAAALAAAVAVAQTRMMRDVVNHRDISQCYLYLV